MLGFSGGLISFHMIISQLTNNGYDFTNHNSRSALCVNMQGVMLRN